MTDVAGQLGLQNAPRKIRMWVLRWCTGTSLNMASYLARPTVQVASPPAAEPRLVNLQVVPLLAERWSQPPGKTHLNVVPCRWRATGSHVGPPSVSSRLAGSHAVSQPWMRD
jgi:hypothetical protein